MIMLSHADVKFYRIPPEKWRFAGKIHFQMYFLFYTYVETQIHHFQDYVFPDTNGIYKILFAKEHIILKYENIVIWHWENNFLPMYFWFEFDKSNFNMAPSLSGQTSIFGFVFFVSSLLWELTDKEIYRNLQFALFNQKASESR